MLRVLAVPLLLGVGLSPALSQTFVVPYVQNAPVSQSNPLPVNSAEKSGAYLSAGSGQYALWVARVTSLTVPPGATVAQICVENADVRYRDDGGAPTASVGMPVNAGTCFQYAGPLGAIRFVAQRGSPTLDVSYYK